MPDTPAKQVSWYPTASHEALIRRARLLAHLREFFALRHVLEVDMPALGASTVSDLHLDSITADTPGRRYLQTSPEYFMKRLLAFGCGPIYSLAKAFRFGDQGRKHNPEFTLLEWYRPGWDEYQLMAEIADLLESVGAGVDGRENGTGGDSRPGLQSVRVSYRDIFLATVNVEPHTESLAELQKIAGQLAHRDFGRESRASCLDLIFSFEVETRLPPGVVFVHDYPVCLAALARLHVDDAGVTVARRFEVFLDRMELANGYFELCDGEEQRRRFDEDNRQRQTMGKSEISADEYFLAALDEGLPSCAGVALGVDRLLMHLVGAEHIREVIAFADKGGQGNIEGGGV